MPYLAARSAFTLPALSLSLTPPPTAHPTARQPALSAPQPPPPMPAVPPKPSAWSTHVHQVYADLKATDPGTTFKQVLTHARASYKK